MTIKEAKELKWGSYVVPAKLYYQTFKPGKRIESGLFLGLNKENRLRVVAKGSGTVNAWHWDFWEKPIDRLDKVISGRKGKL